MVPTFARPNVLSLLSFEGADLFGDTDAETANCDTALEVLEAMLEASELAFCGDVTKHLETETLVYSIAAFKRMPANGSARWPESLVESLREQFTEENGNEDGDDQLSDADEQELLTKMQDVVNWYLERAKVYACEKLQTWRFDNDDLRELVEQLRPDWLKKPEPATSNGET